MKVIFSSDLFTYSAEYFQTVPREKWLYFANSLCRMLKICAWSCLAISHFGVQLWTDVSPCHFYNCFSVTSQFDSVIKENRTILK